MYLFILTNFQLAKLPAEDMSAVYNMKFLDGSSNVKRSPTGTFSLKFRVHKVYLAD